MQEQKESAEEEKIVVKKKDLIRKKTDTHTRYTMEAEIGRGQYGRVMKAIDTIDKKPVAIKIISKWNCANVELVQREIEVLMTLDHPYIGKLYEWYEDDTEFLLVCEYCGGGELFDRIKKNGKLTENYAATLFGQLLAGLSYCHALGVAHRDLKPENCLMLSDQPNAPLKLIDFGLAKIFNDPTFGRIKMTSKVGTPYYIAPEVLNHNYDEKCDIWSAGVILYACVLGGLPFGGKSQAEVYSRILAGFQGFPRGARLSGPCQDLISKMLATNPKDRPSAKEALTHPWFRLQDPTAKIVEVPDDMVSNLAIYQGLEKLKRAIIAYIATQSADMESEQLRTLFVSLDENKDGRISLAELEKALGSHKSHAELVALMHSLDLDKSGFIEYNEFASGVIPAARYFIIQKLQMAFLSMDLNSDQKLSAAEIATRVDKDGLLPPGYWDALVAKYDLNKDGFIDFSEFVLMMNQVQMEVMMIP